MPRLDGIEPDTPPVARHDVIGNDQKAASRKAQKPDGWALLKHINAQAPRPRNAVFNGASESLATVACKDIAFRGNNAGRVLC